MRTRILEGSKARVSAKTIAASLSPLALAWAICSAWVQKNTSRTLVLHSDTDLIVLSFVPSTRKGEPLTIEEAPETARIVEKMQGTHRLLLHDRVNPNQDGDLEGMDALAEPYRISAGKTYAQWGPAGKGSFSTTPPG